MKNYAIVVFREDGSKFIRSFHSSLVSARRIVADVSGCPFLSHRSYRVFDLSKHVYCK